MKTDNLKKKIKDFNNSLKNVEIFLNKYIKTIKLSKILKNIYKL